MSAPGAVVLSAQGLQRNFGLRQVLADATLSIHEGERIGVVGVNGSGKTTMGRLLAGTDEPDAGAVTLQRGATVGYLEQVPELDESATARAIVLSGLANWSEAKAAYDACSQRIAQGAEDLDGLLEEQAAQAEVIERSGGWDMDHRADAMLDHLGIPDPNKRIGEMSGGERRRVALARLLVSSPTVAILDEPTNHLDVETIDWLERYLVDDFTGALLLITHDRYLLDRVVDRTCEVDDGRLHLYAGGYGDFLGAKAERMAHVQRTEANRQNFLRRELEWLRRQPKARSTKQKARISRANVALDADAPKAAQAVSLEATATRSGRTILELRDLVVDLGGQRLVDGLTLSLSQGDRIGVVGRNGVGKTSLLRAILGELEPTGGEIRLGKNTKIAYLDQTRTGLDPNDTVFEAVAGDRTHVEIGDRSLEVRAWLEHFLFFGLAQRQQIGSLSGGERARVALAKMLSDPANLLILDEPTNDLDVATLGALESLLMDFRGTALVVTHDRYFLDRVATSILAFEGNGKVDHYVGNYSLYRQLRARQEAEEARPGPSDESTTQPKANKKPAPRRKSGLSYGERRELDALEGRIEQTEQRVAELEAQLADPSTYSEGPARGRELDAQLKQSQGELETQMSRWEELEAKSAETPS